MAERFLLIRLSAAGDVIHALPLPAALRDAFPSAHIAWAVERGSAELLADNPDVDELILLDPPSVRWTDWRGSGNGLGWREMLAGLRRVRGGGFEVALDAQGLIKSGLLALWSGAPMRLGFEHRACKEGLNVAFTTHQVPLPDGPHHVVEKNLKLLEPLGVRASRIRFPLPRREEDEDYIARFLRRAGLGEDAPLAAIHPWAGWETKRWGEERFAALADRLAAVGARVILTWGPGEEGASRRVASAMTRAPHIAPPTTWRQLAALLRRVRLFVGGDTGPLHLAAALGVPCLALMGPTNPVRNGPLGGHAAPGEEPAPLSPSYSPGGQKSGESRSGPVAGGHAAPGGEPALLSPPRQPGLHQSEHPRSARVPAGTPVAGRHVVLHRRLWCSDCYGRTCPDIECMRSLGLDLVAREALALWERGGGA